MGRQDIVEKVNEGKKLTDEEFQWAFEHGIPFPTGSEDPRAEQLASQALAPGNVPPNPVVSAPQFAPAPGGAGQVRVVLLDNMTKAGLEEFAAEQGIELEGKTKADMQNEILEYFESGESGEEPVEEEEA